MQQGMIMIGDRSIFVQPLKHHPNVLLGPGSGVQEHYGAAMAPAESKAHPTAPRTA